MAGHEMPSLKFGKYKGWQLSEVPEDYLEWLISQQQKTIDEYQAEVDRRHSDLSWEQKIVQAGYHALSLKHHPDRGGNTSDMKNLNAAHESLKSKTGR